MATTPSAATSHPIGSLVFGRLQESKYGSLAQFLVAPTVSCAILPPRSSLSKKIDPNEATTLGVAALTSILAIAPYITEGKNDKVLINGGSGGTGTFSIQIAKALGCHVTVTCSTSKIQLCKSLGADEVIDYTTVGDLCEAVKSKGKIYKLCVDNVGFPAGLYKAADEFLVEGGRFVQVGGGFSWEMVSSTLSRVLRPRLLGGGRQKLEVFVIRHDVASLERLASWVVEGKLRPVVEEVFPFERAVEAFEKLRSGRCYGKLVVRVGE